MKQETLDTIFAVTFGVAGMLLIAALGFLFWSARPDPQHDAHIRAWHTHNAPDFEATPGSGIGVSMSGRLGVELGPGVVLTQDGISIGVGF